MEQYKLKLEIKKESNEKNIHMRTVYRMKFRYQIMLAIFTVFIALKMTANLQWYSTFMTMTAFFCFLLFMGTKITIETEFDKINFTVEEDI